MFTRICLSLVLLGAMPAWCQDTEAAEAPTNPSEDSRMLVPPPVNGDNYPTAVGSETRSNYLRAGLSFNTAYSDNVLGGASANPVSDISYSIRPTIELDQTTARLHSMLTYSPGFTFYQKTSSRNKQDQSVLLDFQDRLSSHVTASLRESFLKSSSLFNQPVPLSAGGVPGSGEPPPEAVIAPVADQLTNATNAELTYQFSRSGMIGVSGTYTDLHYPNPAEVPGLYDSNSRGGSAFYNHRLSKKHYLGASYRYSRFLAGPSETQTHTVFAFYTIYLKPTLSLSVSGGPQHFDVVQPPFPPSGSWSPAATASMGWQGRRTNFAASYSRMVSGGGGLLGAYHSNTANASARWRLARTWYVGSRANYAIHKNVTPLFFLASPGGHSISGTVSVQHTISGHFNAELGYTRLHQSYDGIAVISNNPDTNREYISISYQFVRPLGR
jgi:hypothetical protein